ncbi:MAG: N-6 DNA methylase, partial [Actinomycetes bacterium]
PPALRGIGQTVGVSTAARDLVDAYERALDPGERRQRGVHHTPSALARALVDLGMTALGRLPQTIVDPSCGGGAFLLAAADALVDLGVPPMDVLDHRLIGAEFDPDAVTVVQRAFERWAVDHRVDPRRVRVPVLVGDALARTPEAWRAALPNGADLVVGNPPFLSPRAADVAPSAAERAERIERFGDLGGMVDTAALFLLLSTELLSEDGVAVVIQPRSTLSARGAVAIRGRVASRAPMVALWSDDAKWFDANVAVCAPILRRGSRPAGVRVLRGVPGTTVATVDHPQDDSWGPTLAPAYGIPLVRLGGLGALRDLSAATAGFRDEYYAVRDAVVDDPLGCGAPVVSVGMIDVADLTWGRHPVRLGGRQVRHPRVQVDAIEPPRVARWVTARQVPKVLVATQTKIVEAVVDASGTFVPLTPVISIEPFSTADLWRVAAVVLAPPVAASALATGLGSGRSPSVLRWSARQALGTPLPIDLSAWDAGAALIESVHGAQGPERSALLGRFARVMNEAYGVAPSDALEQWWLERADGPRSSGLTAT